MKKKKTVTLKVTEDFDAQLRGAAYERDVSTSDLVREAVAEYIARPVHARFGSFLEQAGDIIGSVEGASDLSTNKAHMKSFGK